MNRMLLAAFVAAVTAGGAFAQPGRSARSFDKVVKKVEATFEPATAKRGETITWKLTVEVADGWHTYPTKQTDPAAQTNVNKITPPTVGSAVFVPNTLVEPAGAKTKAEADVKELRYYEGTVTWEMKAVVNPGAAPGEMVVEVPVKILACDDKGCLPPQSVKTKAKLTIANGPAVPVDPKYADLFKAAAAPGGPPAPPAVDAVPPTADYAKALAALENQITGGAGGAKNSGLAAFMLTAAAWGLISLVTPCVFPMIPITVSYFLKQSEKTHVNPLRQAVVYCGTIVVVLGVAAVTLLGMFRALSINPWTNVAIGLLFVVLALSLFGMFELTLPNWLVRWTSSRESRGGMVGTVFMALTFTIVSFTCVAPFLGGFAGIAASGQFRWWEMLAGALAFSTAFAAPFFVLALFPSLLRKLPRSGGWLNLVKVVMGFLELAAALKFFRTAELRWSPEPAYFTYDLILGLWVALMAVCGLYLLNLFRLGHEEPQETIGVGRMLLGLGFLGLALYILPGVFKDAAGNRQRPDGVLFAYIDAFLLPEPPKGGAAPGELQWTADLPRAVRHAAAARRKVFVDFTGVTCTNCKINERNVFTRPEVRELFKKYQLVQMYTDVVPAEFYAGRTTDEQRERDAAANLAFQKNKFQDEQLPLYVILEPQPDGRVLVVDRYDEGKINDVEKFAEFLRKPVAADTARADANVSHR
jgi:thiol:disulfide interchange protein